MIKLMQFLGNRNAGFLLGLLTVFGLALGSFVMNLYPKTYPAFFMFDLNYFFNPVKPVHFWLYLLLAIFAAFGVNLLAYTIESFIVIIQTRAWRGRKFAAFLVHLSLLLGLMAHLHEGFYVETKHQHITDRNTPISDFGFASVKSIRSTYHPDGSLKDTDAEVEFRLTGKEMVQLNISYNSPAIFDLGQRAVILQQGGEYPAGIVLAEKQSGEIFRLARGVPTVSTNVTMLLTDIFSTDMGFPFARIMWSIDGAKKNVSMIALKEGLDYYNQIRAGNKTFQFQGIHKTPYVRAMLRYNPSLPLMLVSATLMFFGLLLMMKKMKGNSNDIRLPNLVTETRSNSGENDEKS